jgi:hypothetical protein
MRDTYNKQIYDSYYIYILSNKAISLLSLLLFTFRSLLLREWINHQANFWRWIFASIRVEFKFLRDFYCFLYNNCVLRNVVCVETGFNTLYLKHLLNFVCLNAVF